MLAGHAASVAEGLRPEDFPRQEGRFDIVVAFGVVEYHEHPEEFVSEAKRLLKEDGILIISTLDKQTYSNERNRRDPARKGEMYVPEFREMLERSFERVSLHRLGAVCGAVVLPEDGDLDAVTIKGADFYSRDLLSDSGPPTTRHALAVCGGPEAVEPRGAGGRHLHARGGRAIDEGEEAHEDARLLREEIEHMRKTEIQAFGDAVRIAASERMLQEVARRLGLSRKRRVQRAIEASLPLVTLLSRAYRVARSLRRKLRRRGNADG